MPLLPPRAIRIQRHPRRLRGILQRLKGRAVVGDDIAGVYIEHALPVVQEQLLRARIRLAKIIILILKRASAPSPRGQLL
jgi:hypothetical protein